MFKKPWPNVLLLLLIFFNFFALQLPNTDWTFLFMLNGMSFFGWAIMQLESDMPIN